jgi:cation:H+ antiporter
LTVLLGVYITWTYRFSKSEPEAVQEEFAEAVRKGRSRILYVVLILIGLAGLKYGADLIVHGAVGIASTLGISERVIGLTIVAIGTSLPEIATSLVAVRRNQPDIAVGNVVGSNIFNILSVIGISAIIASPISIDASALSWDFPVMVVATLIVLPLMASGHRISRREGLVLLSMFVVYIGYTGLSG